MTERAGSSHKVGYLSQPPSLPAPQPPSLPVLAAALSVHSGSQRSQRLSALTATLGVVVYYTTFFSLTVSPLIDAKDANCQEQTIALCTELSVSRA